MAVGPVVGTSARTVADAETVAVGVGGGKEDVVMTLEVGGLVGGV